MSPDPEAPPAPDAPPRAFTHRLAVLAWLGLGPGLAEAGALLRHAPQLGWGLLVAFLGLATWVCLGVVAGLPWLLAALSPATRGRVAETSPASPGPVTWLAALAVCAAPGAVAAFLLTPGLTAAVSPGSQPFVALLVSALLPALTATAAPALASLLARLTPRRLRGPRVRLAAMCVVGAGLGLVLDRIDPRFWGLGLALPAGALAGLGRPWARRAGLVFAAAAPVVLGATLAGLLLAPASAMRGPAPFGLVLGAIQPPLAAATDDDDDGHGDAYGGLDCDDSKATIHPGAREIPKNGVDENCRGGDLKGDFKRAALPSAPAAPSGPASAPPPPAPHIVLIVIDSGRADAFGPESGLTPNLDRLATQGARFTQAHAASSATRFSVPALLTGRWVAHTDYRERPNEYRLDDRFTTLPTALAARGYVSLAEVPTIPHMQTPGLRKGFTTVREVTGADGRRTNDHTTPEIVPRILKFLNETGSKPGFVYAHLMDAHHPYRRTPQRPAGESGPIADYHGEIGRLDADLAPLIEGLEALRAQREVVLVVTADHGESFMEHGTEFHAQDLYETVLHVPLYVQGPGVRAGLTVDTPVDLLDLGVTLAEFGGATLPRATGSSLRGLLAGVTPKADAPPRPLFAELRVWKAPNPVYASVLEGHDKLILRLDTDERFLYDLAADPGETQNLWAPGHATGARLDALLSAWSEHGNGPAGQLMGTEKPAPKAAKPTPAPKPAAKPAPKSAPASLPPN